MSLAVGGIGLDRIDQANSLAATAGREARRDCDRISPQGRLRLADHGFRAPGAGRGARRGGVGRRATARELAGLARGSGGAAVGGRVRTRVVDARRRALFRRRCREPDRGRDGERVPVPHVDQRRFLPGRARVPRLRHRHGRLRDDPARRPGGAAAHARTAGAALGWRAWERAWTSGRR